MTEDVVVIHGNGRAISGRDAVMADLVRSFENFRVTQTVESEKTVVFGDWAFDRARVFTAITPRTGTEARHFDSRTLTILRRGGSSGWSVARAIGVIVQQR